MLGLKLPTDPRWVGLAEKSLEEILSDHVYCEQKAASTCISLIQQYPEKNEMVDALAPVVTEEWGHFRLVLQEIRKRGLTLGAQRKDAYVNALGGFLQKEGSREIRLMDKLLMAALIEARSCERFRLLSEGLDDAALREFYRGFMISEAGHYRMFLGLAEKYAGKETAQTRWKAWLDFEAEVMRGLELKGERMH